jgi:pimeloyl-ACP methyl ester carboxylesterase
LILIALVVYSSPVRRIPFQQLYTKVPDKIKKSLQAFRKNHARYRCALDYFEPPVSKAAKMPVMIIEADNDPLVEEILREMLKTTYPSAQIKTLHSVGHFPYLNQPEEYVQILLEFLNGNTP